MPPTYWPGDTISAQCVARVPSVARHTVENGCLSLACSKRRVCTRRRLRHGLTHVVADAPARRARSLAYGLHMYWGEQTEAH